ncbi:MAG: DUF2937 family protein [Planktotalea sp.]|uniref:DUF2937 family protein n=1 Tax=Planktotalea sp. TaxID=2029877 RepID=UPI003C765D8D
MIARALALAAGLTGAAGVSQFPEYSQQYMQRLGGAVDELSRFMDDFDKDAAGLDLTREAALVDLAKGGAMGAARADSMVNTIARHRRLSGDLERMQGLGPFSRAKYAARFTDTELAGRVWENYKPAMPVTFEGAIFAGLGFLGGLALFSMLIWVLRLPFSLFRRTSES